MSDRPRPLGLISMGLSGGGSRAAGFHLGVLWYLDHLDLLQDVAVMSSSSGGSLTNATYAMSQAKGQTFLEYYEWFIGKLNTAQMVEWVFAKFAHGEPKNLSHRRSLVIALAEVYNEYFFENFKFGGLIDKKPGHLEDVVINATDFRTGLGFRFHRLDPVGNGRMHLEPSHIRNMRLADAMAASSCLPGGLEPLFFPEDFVWDDEPAREDAKRILNRLRSHDVETVHLMDGGINDNQGLEGLMLAAIRIAEHDDPNAEDRAFQKGKELVASGDDAQAHLYEFDLLFQRVATDSIPPEPPGAIILSDAPLDPDPVYRGGYAPGDAKPLVGLKPPPDRGPTLARVATWWWWLRLFCGASIVALAVALIYSLATNGFHVVRFIAVETTLYVFPLALCVAGWYALQWMKRQGVVLVNGVNNVLRIEGMPGKSRRTGDIKGAWYYIQRLRLSNVLYLLGLRGSSVLSLASDIFFIRTRILNYTTLYTLPGWRDQVITNEIYDVLNASGVEVPRATQPMQKVASIAANLPTAFWFERPDDLPSLIASGQMNMCLNLIIYLRRRRRQHRESFTPEHAALLARAEADWAILEADPRAFAPSTARLSALQAQI